MLNTNPATEFHGPGSFAGCAKAPWFGYSVLAGSLTHRNNYLFPERLCDEQVDGAVG